MLDGQVLKIVKNTIIDNSQSKANQNKSKNKLVDHFYIDFRILMKDEFLSNFQRDSEIFEEHATDLWISKWLYSINKKYPTNIE